MRFFSICAVTFLVVLAACNKDDISDPSKRSLQGEWKLLVVKDKSTRSEFFRPSGSSGNIVIRFNNNGFSGHTLVNTISSGAYTLDNETDLTIGIFNMTKLGEDQWGSMFITVLNACTLQSVFPCRPSKVSFEGNKLIIESPLRYDLTFVKN